LLHESWHCCCCCFCCKSFALCEYAEICLFCPEQQVVKVPMWCHSWAGESSCYRCKGKNCINKLESCQSKLYMLGSLCMKFVHASVSKHWLYFCSFWTTKHVSKHIEGKLGLFVYEILARRW
jgi:hypothetical protein